MTIKDFEAHALVIGLATDAFRQCLDSGTTAKEIREDFAEGQKASVRGTPTFFIGRTNPNNSAVKVVTVVRGAQAYPKFQVALDSLLAAQKPSAKPPK